MADELIEIFDENNYPLNQQMMKIKAHQNGLWHRAVHIWVYNSNGDILLQLRSKIKDLYPKMWEISATGHVSVGEEPIISALREIKEEIGLSINENDLNFFQIRKQKSIYKKIINNEFYYVFFYKYDGDISKLKLQKEEVEEIRFIPLDDIEIELKNNSEKYIPYGEYWFDIIKEIRSKKIPKNR